MSQEGLLRQTTKRIHIKALTQLSEFVQKNGVWWTFWPEVKQKQPPHKGK